MNYTQKAILTLMASINTAKGLTLEIIDEDSIVLQLCDELQAVSS